MAVSDIPCRGLTSHEPDVVPTAAQHTQNNWDLCTAHHQAHNAYIGYACCLLKADTCNHQPGCPVVMGSQLDAPARSWCQDHSR